MKRAILSDIHGNLEALEASLEDARSQGVEEFYCLGDIVGYGPNPRECVDLVRPFARTILGNHDSAALFDPEGFSAGAEKAIHWTRAQVELPQGDSRQENDACLARMRFLCKLPRVLREENVLYVHGSARNPLNEYVFPEDVHCKPKYVKIFQAIQRLCFQGHTHVPGVFTQRGQFTRSSELQGPYRFHGEGKWMVNVGSVGQPRDGDPRACYVIFDGESVVYRRVEYDREKTIAKIYAIPEIDRAQGDRLREGH